MDLKKEFATDKTKEIEGDWFDMGDNCKMLIARTGNPNYQKVFRKLTKPHKRAIRADRLPDSVADQILIKAMSKTILLNWEGLEEDGIEISYSEANAVRILTDYKDLRDTVSDISSEMESFKTEEDSDGEGNLEAS